MKMAFTLDDLPLWPMSYPQAGYSVPGIVDAIIAALERHRIKGVYAFANSWALIKHPEFTDIMGHWLAAGHHVANHTHSHVELNTVSTDDYIADINLGQRHLEPWLSLAPKRLFRHPLCYWGNTDEKRQRVRSHLAAGGYETAEVTSWLYEWRWNRAYKNCQERNDREGLAFVRKSFLEFSLAQLRYDDLTARNFFGRDVIGITLGHTLPFFADIADELFSLLIGEGVGFISLEEALADPAYDDVASVSTDKFLVYQQKLADAAGRPIAMIDPPSQALFERVTLMGIGQTG